MPIDYSKWDKIELSDDSDIEVHPNVDKNSFIKWKQRDIHEKRAQRNVEIKSILVQLTMYAKLNTRVDYLLETLKPTELVDLPTVVKAVDGHFDKTEKFDYEKLIADKGDTLRKGLKDLKFDPEEVENTPPYNEMIEDLFIQVREDHPDASDPSRLVEYLKEHRNKIDDVLSKSTIKLDDLLYQKANLISSDDIHTGFDRSFMNKDKEEKEAEAAAAKAPAKSTAKKETSIETIHTPSTTPAAQKSEKDILDELELLPETEVFSRISASDIPASADYLFKHTKICTEQQKDALIMTAFDAQLEGDSQSALQVIHQSLLLQYISQLAGPHPNKDQTIKAVKLFCSKISDSTSPAKQGFIQDVQNTFNHVKTRCEIIKKEQAENQPAEGEEEAVIQLKALDDGTELSVNLPEEGTAEFEIFSTKLSAEFQQAVRAGSLEEVNKEFAKLKVEDAEQVLEVFNECGVIGINGYLEDEEEFKQLQQQYNDNLEIQDHEEEEEKEEAVFNTVDEVD